MANSSQGLFKDCFRWYTVASMVFYVFFKTKRKYHSYFPKPVRLALVCTHMLVVCTRMLVVCARMLVVCTCMLVVCTRMLVVCTRMLVACTRMLVAC